MSEFAKPSPANTSFMELGVVDGSPMPSTVLSVWFTFGSLGSLVPSSNESGFLSSVMCSRPLAVSPASYMPGDNFARGSLASEPVIPAGSGAAGSGANGFTSPSGGFVSVGFADSGDAAGVADGAGVCASTVVAKQKQKKTE